MPRPFRGRYLSYTIPPKAQKDKKRPSFQNRHPLFPKNGSKGREAEEKNDDKLEKDPVCSAVDGVKEVVRLADTYPQEDVVQHAWTNICQVYFPDRSLTGEIWSIQREAYRGVETPSAIRLDIVVVKRSLRAIASMGYLQRDYLTVECKAAVHSTPNAWSEAIRQATRRLSRYQAQDVFLCMAVGRFSIFFRWTPNDHQAAPLWIDADGIRKELDPRLSPILGPWVDAITREVRPSEARPFNVEDETAREGIENVRKLVRESTLLGANQST
ncbi:MAG: hypothetical protein M1837_006022 [Sclerophora amabilis]|nr:MAG: hypothetical protein M1837_006022 [Sclerophora amabilis]